MDQFTLESSVPFLFDSGKADGSSTEKCPTIETYRHNGSGFRVVFVNMSSPLCSSTIIVPTLAEDNKGLPHTLEHLVFCGSRLAPQRGFLDYLANRCLSTGTNAYTTEDHTGYTIVTAGIEGMKEIFPVFLDHIFYPTLKDSQFMTEVYHIDNEAKHQGVVYCEMASRENTESDLLDNKLRSLLYPKTTYAHECGGRTDDIKTLTNEEIKAYHERFYQIGRATAIMVGSFDVEGSMKKAILEKLVHVPGLLKSVAPPTKSKKGGKNAKREQIVVKDMSKGKKKKHQFEVVHFPSSEDDVGSVAFGWLGPNSDDLTEIIALDVLWRFLSDTSASILYRKFVERSDEPYATDIDFEFKGYVRTGMMVVFSGVPLLKERRIGKKDAEDEDGSQSSGSGDDGDMDDDSEDDESGDEEDDDDDDEEEDADDDEDSNDNMTEGTDSYQSTADEPTSTSPKPPLPDLFAPGYFRKLLFEELERLGESGFDESDNGKESDWERLKQCLCRHRIKTLESIEDDPHETMSSYLIPDIVLQSFGPDATKSTIGTRGQLLPIITNVLPSKPGSFWRDLVKRHLLDNSSVEIHMIPDKTLAKKLATKESQEQAERLKEYTEKQLIASLKSKVEWALKENEINLSKSMMEAMPSVPKDLSDIRMDMDFVVKNTYTPENNTRPWTHAVCVSTPTRFLHFKMCLNTWKIPHHLRNWVVLFQELLFQTDLRVPSTSQKDSEFETIPWQAVSSRSAELFVSHEAAFGLGNDLWSASWLSEMFVMDCVTECLPNRMTESIQWLLKVLLWSQFTKERVLTIAKNLRREISELKREGGDMLWYVTNRVIYHTTESELASQKDFVTSGNDRYMNMFRQETFLKQAVQILEKGTAEEQEAFLNVFDEIRVALLESCPLDYLTTELDNTFATPMNYGDAPGFVIVGGPLDLISTKDTNATIDTLNAAWDGCVNEWKEKRQKVMHQTQAHNGNMEKLNTMSISGLAVPQKRKLSISSSTASPVSTKKPDNQNNTNRKSLNAFPLPRYTYDPRELIFFADKEHKAIVCPISGLATSFMCQIVDCDLLSEAYDTGDYWAVALLAELLSRTEGPLFTRIRGPGYAYNTSLHLSLWAGQMSFEVYDSSEPFKSLLAFYDILEKLGASESDFESLVNDWEMDTARASVLYRLVANRSTAVGKVAQSLRAVVRGFESVQEDRTHEDAIGKVTRQDCWRVYQKYFTRFLDPQRRLTVMTTVPGEKAEELINAFKNGVDAVAETDSEAVKYLDKTKREKYQIKFTKMALSELRE